MSFKTECVFSSFNFMFAFLCDEQNFKSVVFNYSIVQASVFILPLSLLA